MGQKGTDMEGRNKTRGPLVQDLTDAIEKMDGVSQLGFHRVQGSVCATVQLDRSQFNNFAMTSAYGSNKLHALVRLLTRVMELRSGT